MRVTTPDTESTVLALAVLALAAAGCLGAGGDGSPQAGPTEAPDEKGDPSGGQEPAEPTRLGRWNSTLHATPTYRASEGVAFENFASARSTCETYLKVLVQNATRLHVRLEDPEPKDPGEGVLTFFLETPRSRKVYPPGTVTSPALDRKIYRRSSDTVEIGIDDPTGGVWAVWTWPHKVIREEAWNLTIEAEGPGDGALKRVEVDGALDEC